MLMPKDKSKLILRLLAVFFGVILMVLLVIPVLGPCWHLLYGDAISYGGWKVPVPKGFYVRKSPEGPTMWKESFGIPFFNAPYGHISLFRPQQPFSFDRDYARFKKGVTQDAVEKGYELKKEWTAQVGKNSGYCLELSRSPEPRSLLRCAVENGVVLFYEGDPRYIPEVLSALQGMSEKTANTSKPGAGPFDIRKGPGLKPTSSTSVTREFFSSARRRSLLLIAVRPRNFTIRCFLLYF